MCGILASSLRVAALAGLIVLAGCEDEQAEAPPPPIRAIKYSILKQGVEAQQRGISAVVEAATTSNVAFQTAGQVVELTRKAGDTVAEGEVLARLDPEPLRLKLSGAQSELQQAEAALADAESKYAQQEKLFQGGYTTRTNYETSLANLRTARGTLGVARSQVDIARRDLEKAELRAPFAGIIAKRNVERFEEVSSGQAIYTLQTEADTEVRVSLPETLVSAVSVGDTVKVEIGLVSQEPVDGRVIEIAPLSEGANAYPLAIRLQDPPPGLKPGMSAEAIFEFRTPGGDDAFTIPIAAMKPGVGTEGGEVFVFEDGRLSVRKVRVVNIRDNSLQIVGEVRPGDVVATAGVSQLHDGMQVRLLDPADLR